MFYRGLLKIIPNGWMVAGGGVGVSTLYCVFSTRSVHDSLKKNQQGSIAGVPRTRANRSKKKEVVVTTTRNCSS